MRDEATGTKTLEVSSTLTRRSLLQGAGWMIAATALSPANASAAFAADTILESKPTVSPVKMRA